MIDEGGTVRRDHAGAAHGAAGPVTPKILVHGSHHHTNAGAPAVLAGKEKPHAAGTAAIPECVKCMLREFPQLMLGCFACSRAIHFYCMNPPRVQFPDAPWMCRLCLDEEVRRVPRKSKKQRLNAWLKTASSASSEICRSEVQAQDRHPCHISPDRHATQIHNLLTELDLESVLSSPELSQEFLEQVVMQLARQKGGLLRELKTASAARPQSVPTETQHVVNAALERNPQGVGGEGANALTVFNGPENADFVHLSNLPKLQTEAHAHHSSDFRSQLQPKLLDSAAAAPELRRENDEWVLGAQTRRP
ncbi:hypothetical protein FVE85_0605 [Porphyridium purpureum]|uniref:PHD-type domain-containing protein n=1 Tax=Porphyridium purpureum TaxID=35688 RepID=A0A5J4YZT9_PORPP|nr:hypothetical protein FVE85_0605 [Porphyridium purpureum]|eukprot:POR1990..scf208_2